MATELLSEIDEAAAQGEPVDSILSNKMMGAIQGHTWNKALVGATTSNYNGQVMEGGSRSLDSAESTDRAFRAERSLRKEIKRGIASPSEVIKGLNPSFVAEYGLFLTSGSGRVDPQVAQLQEQVGILSAELGKSFTTTNSGLAGVSLTPFDLSAPSRLIYWFDTPLRAKIPRTKGIGTSHRTKVLTGISGSQTGGAHGAIKDHSLGAAFDTSMDFTGAAGTYPVIPGGGLQVGEDVNIPYKFFGQSESLSWLAQFAGQGFEDIAALANLVLMQEMHFADEYMVIGGSTIALEVPTFTLTVRAAGTGEVGIDQSAGEDLTVCVTAANYFGETVAAAAQVAETAANTNVVDVVITPAGDGAAQQFGVYAAQSTEIVATTATFKLAQVGGTKYTIQGGVLPVSGAAPPTSDSGTASANRFEGILSCLSGQAAEGGGNGYPADFKGGYINLNVQDTLNLNVLNTALQQVYNGPGAFRASPTELLCDGADAKSLSVDVAKNGSGTGYQLKIDQNQTAGVIHGTAVSQVVNPVTRRLVDVTVHPGWLQGVAALLSYTTPNAVRNSNVFEMVMVQDLLSVAWPVTDPSYRFSMFEYGTLVCNAPQYCAILGGLQQSAVAPWK
jgi:hypothetical protein